MIDYHNFAILSISLGEQIFITIVVTIRENNNTAIDKNNSFDDRNKYLQSLSPMMTAHDEITYDYI